MITRSGVVVQSIYINGEGTDRLTKFWQLDSWLLGRQFYWYTATPSPITKNWKVHHLILNTWYGIGFQIIYISNKSTNIVTKCWQPFSWVFLGCHYQWVVCRKSCLYLNFIKFELIIMIIISHDYFNICYALRKHWFDCLIII